MRGLTRTLRRRPGSVQVVAGMGGVGKSAVAPALCFQARRRRWWRRRRSVWWVSAADQASLTAGMIGVARHIGGSEQDRRAIARGAADAPERLWALLERARRGWLLVVDNADQPDLLAAPAPAGNPTPPPTVADGTGWIRPTHRGLVVVTSRIGDRQVWGAGQVNVHRLGVLDPEDATTVLLDLLDGRRSGGRPRRAGAMPVREQDAARDLAVRLGGLPLALHLAGGAIGSDFSSWTSFADYRRALDASGPVLLEPDPDMALAADPRAAVARTWELSLDTLAAHRIPQARPLLRLLSCYAPAVPIPASLLADPALGELLAGPEGRWRSQDLLHARHALARVGLIEVVDVPGAVDERQGIVVHPLVADTNRSHLAGAGADEAAAAVRHAAVTLLAHATASVDFVLTTGIGGLRLQRFAPHVHALLASVAALLPADDLAALMDIVAKTVHFHILSGADRAAHELGHAALAHSHRVGTDHPAVVRLRFRFARSIMRLGHWNEAETQFRDVGNDMARVLGPNDPETLLARLHVIGNGPARRGPWEQAEAEYRRLIEDMTRALGPTHLYTFIARSDFASTAAEQGHWLQVQTECRQLLDDMARVPDRDQLLTLFARVDLARAAGKMGRWEQAETDLRQVLDENTRLLGPDHPDTLAVCRELARAVGELGRWDEADTEFRQVITHMARVLGPDHPETLSTRLARVQAMAQPGRWDQAAAEYRQLLDDVSRSLGRDHPYTLRTRRELTQVVGELGFRQQADTELRQVVDHMIRVLGPEHPETRAAHATLTQQREQPRD